MRLTADQQEAPASEQQEQGHLSISFKSRKTLRERLTSSFLELRPMLAYFKSRFPRETAFLAFGVG